ncbi:hypothetical protein GPJ56_007302 [Histomonas meleagridis]|uniref:uncharacterized protein n=1 Tax=Histomonas meleagridis TaxID=135588 RepID=UPI003559FA61|nr:hypothetical protein GPJ56_007302 [Histomonas meleagridis]KAH0804148.1 hypothetical protein GO595_002978 [Histomonas meleagridis]
MTAEISASFGEEIYLDQNVAFKFNVLGTPSASFKIPFSHFPSETNDFKYHPEPVMSNNPSIYCGVPFYFLVQIRSRRNNLHNLQITGRSKFKDSVELRLVDDPRSQPSSDYSLPNRTLTKDPLYYVIEARCHSIENHSILTSIRYSLDNRSETKNFCICLDYDVEYPFIILTSAHIVGNEGVLARVSLTNNMAYTIHDLQVELINDEFFLPPYEEDDFSIADSLLPKNSVSKVYQLEFSHKDDESVTTTKLIVGRIIVKWRCLSFTCEFKCPNPINLELSEPIINFPLSVEMIGSPQAMNILTPFIVKIHVQNSSENKMEFSFNIKADPQNCIAPYGSHLVKGSLNSKESLRFDMQFIGMRQGLLPYPDFVVSYKEENGETKEGIFHQESGVLILNDAANINSRNFAYFSES